MEFWGRQRELARLRDELEQVRKSGQGKMLSVRGRRQAGKSRLLTELVESAGVPYLLTTAIRHGALMQQFEQVATDLRSSRHPLPALDLLDVFLVTGGYPRVVSAARRHRNAASLVRSEVEDDQSALAVTGSRMLDAEFREQLRARTVLEAIGSVEMGHATFSSAVERLGGDDRTTWTAVTRALPILAEDKRVVARQAIEPVIHEAVSRLPRTDPQLSGLVMVGGWWDRTGDHEYDLVDAERNGEVTVVGTVKWRARRAVTVEELSRLSEARPVVPRAGGAKLAVVCPADARAGVDPDVLLDAGDVLDAFR